mmetsp:Transcript_118037/g.328143  ORF Transcript_118037/g.328143 Transcript_118037/m.328143 type:complete len:263 (+) Transcript_118037:354-1142(+)
MGAQPGRRWRFSELQGRRCAAADHPRPRGLRHVPRDHSEARGPPVPPGHRVLGVCARARREAGRVERARVLLRCGGSGADLARAPGAPHRWARWAAAAVRGVRRRGAGGGRSAWAESPEVCRRLRRESGGRLAAGDRPDRELGRCRVRRPRRGGLLLHAALRRGVREERPSAVRPLAEARAAARRPPPDLRGRLPGGAPGAGRRGRLRARLCEAEGKRGKPADAGEAKACALVRRLGRAQALGAFRVGRCRRRRRLLHVVTR